jgi:MFS family permease
MPSGALDAITEHFHVSSQVNLTLLNSLYMVGYVLGPLLFGPLSEYIGRRPVLIVTFLGYLVFMLACSGAPTFPALLVFRLLCGVNAAAPTTVISGLYADILDIPSQRGTAIALYMTVTSIGTFIGPIISGYTSQTSWRWPFWAAALITVPGLPIVLTVPETFAPVLYNKEVCRRIETGYDASGETMMQHQAFNVRKTFLRPLILLVTEPILLSTSLYLALAYSITYLMFQAYPVVFQGTSCYTFHNLALTSIGYYGLAPGPASLAWIPSRYSFTIIHLVF